MGACCAGARPAQSASIYSISSDGFSIFEYSIIQDQFFHHQLGSELPSMCKYCEIPQDKLLIVGGFTRMKGKLGQPVGEVFLFSKSSGLQKLEPLPTPRTGHCLIESSGKVYLVSGVVSHIQPTSSCQRFDYFSNCWSDISPLSKPRVLASGCSTTNFLYVTGGNPGNSLENFRDIERYNLQEDRWTVLEVRLPCDLWRHTCLAFQGGLIIFGGNCNKSYNLNCFKVKLDQNVIIQQTWLRQGGEFSGCSLVVQDKVFTFETSSNHAVWMYDQGKWTSKINNCRVETSTVNNLFCCKNRSPSFQESVGFNEERLSELENENYYLKKKVKELEESTLKTNDEFLSNDIHRIKEFQEKEQKWLREVEIMEQRFNKLRWKYESLVQENSFLQKQVKDLNDDKKKLENASEERILEFNEIVSKFRYVESQLEYEKTRRKEKTFEYKQRISRLVQEFQEFSEEKDRIIEKLEEKVKLNKNFCKSPLKSSRTPRKNSVNQLLEITNTISSLEKSQAEYKQKYINLQKSKIGSFKEIHHLYDILKNNEKRLKQAKKLQENIFKN